MKNIIINHKAPHYCKLSDPICGIKKFFIPSYQRNISWDDDKIDTDLDNLIERIIEKEEPEPCFGEIDLGTYLYHKENYLLVTDGLQRVSTTIILAYKIYHFLQKRNTDQQIDNVLQKKFDIQNLDAIKRMMDKGLSQKITFEYGSHQTDKDVIDSAIEGKSIPKNSTGKTVRDMLKRMDVRIEGIHRKYDFDGLLRILLALVPSHNDDDIKNKGLSCVLFIPHVMEGPSGYDYYEEYTIRNTLKKEHNQMHQLKLKIGECCKKIEKYDGAQKFDEIKEKYFENQSSLFRTYAFVCLYRHVLKVNPELFVKNMQADQFQTLWKEIEQNHGIEKAKEVYTGFYDDFCGEYVDRFFEIIDLPKTVAKLKTYAPANDKVFPDGFDFVFLQTERNRKDDDDHVTSQTGLYYAILAIDGLMENHQYDSPEKFKQSDFKKDLNNLIRYVIYRKLVSAKDFTDKYVKLILNINDNSINNQNKTYNTFSISYPQVLAACETRKIPKSPDKFSKFLLSLIEVDKDREWAIKLLTFCNDKYQSTWDVDHFAPKELYTPEDIHKMAQMAGVSDDEYKDVLETMANKRLLEAGKNRGHRNYEQDDHPTELPTYEQLQKKLEEKVKILIASPFLRGEK